MLGSRNPRLPLRAARLVAPALALAFGPLAFGAVSTVTASPASATTGTVTVSGSMEGNLPIKPGDPLRAGFDITMPGSHPAAQVNESGGTVTIAIVCPDHSTPSPIVITLPNETFSIPANNSQWFPSGDQSSGLVYQGHLTAPNACSGATYHAPGGATFSATFSSTDTSNPVHLRFHYSDNTSGSWSGTASFVPPFAPPAPQVAYFDNYRIGSTPPPSPWQNSSGITFVGCNSPGSGCTTTTSNGKTVFQYDGGAIMLPNPTSSAVNIDAVSVTIGNCTFNPWSTLTLSIPAGGSLILTQTGISSAPGPQGSGSCLTASQPNDKTENFDTSQTVPQGSSECSNDNLVPSISVTIGGSTHVYSDSHQVLNTGGLDVGATCNGGKNETEPWSTL